MSTLVKAQQTDVCLSAIESSAGSSLPSLQDTVISRGTMDLSKAWPTGSTLRIKFLNGDSLLHNKVMRYAREWTVFGNIFFEQVKDGDAEIRVLFDSLKGNYSTIGIDANTKPLSAATTHFDFTSQTEERIVRRHVLHEFGHILGLLHENSSPYAAIDWNKDTVYQYYKKQKGWSTKEVDENVFKSYEASFTNGEFDERSIMCYRVPAFFTKSKKALVAYNMELSDGDKKLVAQMYPPDSTASSVDVPKVKYSIIPMITTEKGMLVIKPSFNLLNGNGFLFKIGAYFFDDANRPLKDAGGSNRSRDGQAAAIASIQPCCKEISFGASGNHHIHLALPLSVLPIKKGDNHFKYQLVLWSGNSKIYTSPKYLLDFTN